MLSKANKQYETAIKETLQVEYGKEKGKKLFWKVYDQHKVGFKDRHEENVRFITKTIEKVSHSKAFTSKQKLYLYLNQIEMALELAEKIAKKHPSFVKGKEAKS